MKLHEKLLLPHLGWARKRTAQGINTHYWVEISEDNAISVCGQKAEIDNLMTRGEHFVICSTCSLHVDASAL